MYLSKAEILKRIGDDVLLENCDSTNVQGAGVDLEMDKLYEIKSCAELSRKSRKLPELNEHNAEVYYLAPGEYYLCTTMERVNMPRDLVAFILPRSTLFRCGVSLRTAVVDPGYRGILTLGIRNESDHEFTLERGSRICQIVFSEVRGEATNYEGKYQGGKVR
jgi:deoxycytidine triphosphate deaminase